MPGLRTGASGVLAIGCGVAGFVIGLLSSTEPWHLRPAYGDLATWLLVVAGVIGGCAAPTPDPAGEVRDEAKRNVKRDQLLDRQLGEAKARELSDQRKQAEGVKASYSVGPSDFFGYVENESQRPITDVTCNIMRKSDRTRIASPDSCSKVDRSTRCHIGGSVQPRTRKSRLMRSPFPDTRCSGREIAAGSPSISMAYLTTGIRSLSPGSRTTPGSDGSWTSTFTLSRQATTTSTCCRGTTAYERALRPPRGSRSQRLQAASVNSMLTTWILSDAALHTRAGARESYGLSRRPADQHRLVLHLGAGAGIRS